MKTLNNNNENEHENTAAISASVLISLTGLMVSLILLSFAAGYYWARYSLAEELVSLYAQDELSDLVAAACYALGEERADTDAAKIREPEQEQLPGNENEQNEQEESSVEVESENSPRASEDNKLLEDRRRYQAVLIGFGELRSAEKYTAKLASLGIEVRVVKRVGKNRKGREVTWYQVVTNSMPYDDLSTLVARLKKTDRLEGVMIIEVETTE